MDLGVVLLSFCGVRLSTQVLNAFIFTGGDHRQEVLTSRSISFSMNHSGHSMDHSGHTMDHSGHTMDHSGHTVDHSGHTVDHSGHEPGAADVAAAVLNATLSAVTTAASQAASAVLHGSGE